MPPVATCRSPDGERPGYQIHVVKLEPDRLAKPQPSGGDQAEQCLIGDPTQRAGRWQPSGRRQQLFDLDHRVDMRSEPSVRASEQAALGHFGGGVHLPKILGEWSDQLDASSTCDRCRIARRGCPCDSDIHSQRSGTCGLRETRELHELFAGDTQIKAHRPS